MKCSGRLRGKQASKCLSEGPILNMRDIYMVIYQDFEGFCQVSFREYVCCFFHFAFFIRGQIYNKSYWKTNLFLFYFIVRFVCPGLKGIRLTGEDLTTKSCLLLSSELHFVKCRTTLNTGKLSNLSSAFICEICGKISFFCSSGNVAPLGLFACAIVVLP